jgi:hypothetical protein
MNSPSTTIFTKSFLVGLLAASIAVAAGCASQRHSGGGSPSASPPSMAGSQPKNSGWYLMQPPIRRGNPDTSAHLADWYVIAFFDQSAPCDAARARGLSAYSSYVQVSTSSAADSVQMSQRLASSSLCVPADDPRINWFHFQWKWK